MGVAYVVYTMGRYGLCSDTVGGCGLCSVYCGWLWSNVCIFMCVYSRLCLLAVVQGARRRGSTN